MAYQLRKERTTTCNKSNTNRPCSQGGGDRASGWMGVFRTEAKGTFCLPKLAPLPTFMVNFGGELPIFNKFQPNSTMLKENLSEKDPNPNPNPNPNPCLETFGPKTQIIGRFD